MKVIIVLALIGIIGALASAGTMMLRRPSDPAANHRAEQPADKRMARALAWRVGLSVALFLFILLAWTLGWIQPSGLPVSSR